MAMVVLMVVLTPALARAQLTDFSRLKVQVGQEVFITDLLSGQCTQGHVRALSASSLELDGQRFVPAQGMRIRKRGDPIWTGAAIGFGVGFAVRGGQGCATTRCGLLAGLVYAALGALLDHGRDGFTTIYERSVPTGMAAADEPAKCPQ
jgi:hypothetical protein